MALVLCTGVDAVLLKPGSLFCRVQVTELSRRWMNRPLRRRARNTYLTWVIGQTASESVKRRIMTLIRTNCSAARVLELYRFSTGKTLEDADAWLEVPADVPQELAEHVNALAAKPRSKSN